MRTALLFLAAAVSLPASRADEPRSFCGHTAAEWAAVLRDRTVPPDERRTAAWALGAFGPEAKAAVPDLIDAAREGPIKEEAVDALVQIGAGAEVTVPDLIGRFFKRGCRHLTGTGSLGYLPHVQDSLVKIGGPAVPALLGVLNGPDRGMRVCAAEALGEIGAGAKGAVPALVRAIEHPEAGSLRRVAVQALGRIGPEAKAAVPTLNALLTKQGDIDVDVAVALTRIGAPPVRKLFDTFLREGDPFVARQLAWLGPQAREAAPSLRAALADRRPRVRASAAAALAHVEPDATEAIPALIEALNGLDEEIDVWDVAGALARFGPKSRAALPALIRLTQKGGVDEDVLKALVQIDPEGAACLPALISALTHEESEVVDAAATALALLGPRAKDAIPALTAAMTRDLKASNGYDAQAAAVDALRRIDPDGTSAVPALIPVLKHRRHSFDEFPLNAAGGDDFSVAAAAARALGDFGAGAKAAVPALTDAAQSREKDDANWDVRKAAILALGRIGPAARSAVPVLRDMANDGRTNAQFLPELTAALAQLAPDGKERAERWLRTPVRLAYFTHWAVLHELEGRALVLGALGRTGLEGDRLTHLYLEHLGSVFADPDPRYESPVVARGWFASLGRLGPAGRAAVPRLTEFSQHPDPWVRLWAKDALERINPPPR